MSIDELVDKLKTHLQGGERFELDFIGYTLKLTERMTPGTAGLYKTTIGAIRRFIMRDSDLDIFEINVTFLKNFVNYIETEPSQRGDNMNQKDKEGGWK